MLRLIIRIDLKGCKGPNWGRMVRAKLRIESKRLRPVPVSSLHATVFKVGRGARILCDFAGNAAVPAAALCNSAKRPDFYEIIQASETPNAAYFFGGEAHGVQTSKRRTRTKAAASRRTPRPLFGHTFGKKYAASGGTPACGARGADHSPTSLPFSRRSFREQIRARVSL